MLFSLTNLLIIEITAFFPGWVAQLVGASSPTPKGCRFDPCGVREATNGCFSHTLFLSPFPSLPLSPCLFPPFLLPSPLLPSSPQSNSGESCGGAGFNYCLLWSLTVSFSFSKMMKQAQNSSRINWYCACLLLQRNEAYLFLCWLCYWGFLLHKHFNWKRKL